MDRRTPDIADAVGIPNPLSTAGGLYARRYQSEVRYVAMRRVRKYIRKRNAIVVGVEMRDFHLARNLTGWASAARSPALLEFE